MRWGAANSTLAHDLLIAMTATKRQERSNGETSHENLGKHAKATAASDLLQLLVTKLCNGLLAGLQLVQEGLTQLLWLLLFCVIRHVYFPFFITQEASGSCLFISEWFPGFLTLDGVCSARSVSREPDISIALLLPKHIRL
jgi:hypothetical protein